LQTGILVWRDFIVPIWTTTIATIWAFAPLLITSGIIGEFIKPIPIVVTMTMLSSTAVAVLITLPLMIVFLKPKFSSRVVTIAKILGFLAGLVLVVLVLPKNIILLPIIIVYCLILWTIYKTRKKLVSSFCKFFQCNVYLGKSFGFLNKLFSRGLIDAEFLSYKYKKLISRILSSKKARNITLLSIFIFSLTSYFLVPLGLVKNEFFPKTDANNFYVNLDFPSGTSIEIVDKQSRQILESLRQTPESKSVVLQVGQKSGSGFGNSQSPNASQITVNLLPEKERKEKSFNLAQKTREKLSQVDFAKVTVAEESSGPPAGEDLQLKISGNDLAVLQTYAGQVEQFLQKQSGVLNVEKSVKPGLSKIVFVADKNKLVQNNIGVEQIGFWLRIYSSGFNLDKVKFDQTEEDVVFYTDKDLQSPEALGSISIPTQSGPLPLLALGELRLETNPTVINREAGKRTISVTATVAKGYNIAQINGQLTDFAKKSLKFASGYEWSIGGVNEENQKSVNSIFRAMGLSFLLILVTMVIQFNSYRQALIVLLTIPQAISGVFVIFAITNTPLSFPALIGILALFGIVVTNAIVIVEKINQNRKEGMDLKEAISDASQGRLEPIMLTALTGIFGLVPITLSDPLWRGLGGAIISGLLFSGIVKLLFIPVVYYAWYKGDKK